MRPENEEKINQTIYFIVLDDGCQETHYWHGCDLFVYEQIATSIIRARMFLSYRDALDHIRHYKASAKRYKKKTKIDSINKFAGQMRIVECSLIETDYIKPDISNREAVDEKNSSDS